jgi:hypothetical protein
MIDQAPVAVPDVQYGQAWHRGLELRTCYDGLTRHVTGFHGVSRAVSAIQNSTSIVDFVVRPSSGGISTASVFQSKSLLLH